MSQLHVLCKIGDSDYAIPADEVYQMDTYSNVTPVPGAPAYVAGLVQVRQQIIPLISARARFGLPPRSADLESRIVVLKLGERLVGVLVDSAREVENISPEAFREPPDVVSAQSGGFVKSIAQLKNRIVMLLDSEKVVGEGVAHV